MISPSKIAGITLAALLHASSLYAQTPDDSAYQSFTQTATEEFGQGHYPEALAAFERAYQIRPTSRVLRGIAKVRFELRQYTAALDAAESALSSSDGLLTPEMRAEMESLRVRALAFTGSLTIQVTPDNAEVLVDGRPISAAQRQSAFRVDVGSHEVSVSAQGYSTATRTVDVTRGGDTQVVVMALTSGGANPLPYIAAAAGVAGAAGVVASLLWMIDRTDAVDRCQVALDRGANCANAPALASERDIALGTLIGASVLTAAGVITFFVSLRGSGSAPAAPAVACAPLPGGMQCAGAIRW